VTITNVMKYDLVEKFDRKWSEFKATYGSTAAESQTTLAFHGTHTLTPSSTCSLGLDGWAACLGGSPWVCPLDMAAWLQARAAI
jgi:hypothetical protein